MINIPNVGNTINRTPSENNQKVASTTTTTDSTPNIKATEAPKFIDRRRNPERRRQSKKPMLDTRRNFDRRRSGRFHTEA